jgi:hypothetical protein
MDRPLPEDFDLAEHYGDAAYDEGYGSEKDDDGASDGDTADDGPKGPAGKPTPELADFAHGNSMQRLIDFALSLIAPPRDASVHESRRHAVALSVAVLMIYGYIAISWGVFSSIGISGFAKADDLATLQDESAEVRVTLYGIAIRDLYRSCRNATDEQDRLALNGELQRVRAKYQKAVGVPYLLPPCIEGQRWNPG